MDPQQSTLKRTTLKQIEENPLTFVNRKFNFYRIGCKWSKKPIGMEVLKKIQRKISLIPSGGNSTDIRLYLFLQSGFMKEIGEFGKKGGIKLIDFRKVLPFYALIYVAINGIDIGF